MEDIPQSVNSSRRVVRKAFACNECKRRKVRCSGEDRCSNCTRDGKTCRYSSPLHTASALQRRLHVAEQRIRAIERAWQVHLPNTKLEDAINQFDPVHEASTVDGVYVATPEPSESVRLVDSVEETPKSVSADPDNVEDYEFDESREFDNTTDGMGFLVADSKKSGYMGPQSGVAALKFLQSLHLGTSMSGESALSPDAPNATGRQEASPADTRHYLEDYFSIYHTAYPILHEATFRARVSGALAKPRDGSWPILYNIVLAIGAFVGATSETRSDVPFYRIAREHLSMDVLEKGSLSYVQALVLMANYLQKRNKPNSGFVLIGIGFSMALAIGLHREFGVTSSNPFTMELRRRVWWTLFIFVSGAQLTLGRPAVSLVGVNVRLPLNLNDQDLAVDMEGLPASREEATISSCLIQQVRLAKVANLVQTELLTNQVPRKTVALNLDQDILRWQKELPSYFDEQIKLETWFEIPKRILIWRSFHLRIVLNRPLLFEIITARTPITMSTAPINACLTAAEQCVQSICNFVESLSKRSRGLAWYATYWLITASFVQATCYAYNPAHTLASDWRAHLGRAVKCLNDLGAAHAMAFRARDIFQKLLDQSNFEPFWESATTAVARPGTALDVWPLSTHVPSRQLFNQANASILNDSIFAGEGDMSAQWYNHGFSDAELFDAAGGIMIQNNSDALGQGLDPMPWMSS